MTNKVRIVVDTEHIIEVFKAEGIKPTEEAHAMMTVLAYAKQRLSELFPLVSEENARLRVLTDKLAEAKIDTKTGPENDTFAIVATISKRA